MSRSPADRLDDIVDAIARIRGAEAVLAAAEARADQDAARRAPMESGAQRGTHLLSAGMHRYDAAANERQQVDEVIADRLLDMLGVEGHRPATQRGRAGSGRW